MSVYRGFEQIQDGRHKRGVRYSVPLILTLILLSKLAGMTMPVAIAEWARLRADWLSQILPHGHQTFPCASTYSNVLQTLDAEQLRRVLAQLLTRIAATKCCGEEPSRLVGQAEREEHIHVALAARCRTACWGMKPRTRKRCLSLASMKPRPGTAEMRRWTETSRMS
jgi:hypothetical protein